MILTSDLLTLPFAQASVSERLLSFLQRQNTIFDRIRYDDALDGNFARLAQPVDTVVGLRLDGLGPTKIQRDDVVCASEIETNTCDTPSVFTSPEV